MLAIFAAATLASMRTHITPLPLKVRCLVAFRVWLPGSYPLSPDWPRAAVYARLKEYLDAVLLRMLEQPRLPPLAMCLLVETRPGAVRALSHSILDSKERAHRWLCERQCFGGRLKRPGDGGFRRRF